MRWKYTSQKLNGIIEKALASTTAWIEKIYATL
jgi:hypothetical protein